MFRARISNSIDTANLAAALTVSALTDEPSSLDEMKVAHPEVCIRENDVLRPLYSALYPSLRQAEYPDIDPLYPGFDPLTADMDNDLKLQLQNKACHAILAPAITYLFWAGSNPWVSCNTHIVEKPVVSGAGYATNLKSWCVARAFDIALERMRLKGTLGMYISEWYPPATCDTSAPAPPPPPLAPPSDSSRRQLFSGDSWFPSRRHLAGKPKKAGSVSGAVAASGPLVYGQVRGLSGVDQMDAIDFLGVFVLWGAASLVTIIAAYVKVCRMKGKRGRLQIRKAAAAPAADGQTGEDDGEVTTPNLTSSYDLEEPRPAQSDAEDMGLSPDFVDAEVEEIVENGDNGDGKKDRKPKKRRNNVRGTTPNIQSIVASQSSQRDAQLLISTLQDALATLRRKDSMPRGRDGPPGNGRDTSPKDLDRPPKPPKGRLDPSPRRRDSSPRRRDSSPRRRTATAATDTYLG